jgi:hypothetical protein
MPTDQDIIFSVLYAGGMCLVLGASIWFSRHSREAKDSGLIGQ